MQRKQKDGEIFSLEKFAYNSFMEIFLNQRTCANNHENNTSGLVMMKNTTVYFNDD